MGLPRNATYFYSKVIRPVARAGGDIPSQGKRGDIRAMKDAVLADPNVKVSDLIEAYGRAGTMLNVIEALRVECIPPRDRNIPHQGMCCA